MEADINFHQIFTICFLSFEREEKGDWSLNSGLQVCKGGIPPLKFVLLKLFALTGLEQRSSPFQPLK
jgi:hypothetical protein